MAEQADVRSGYLFIADISGYTVYLNESELDHAQGTLTSLLEVLVAHSGPPLVLSRLAGDAAISYALREDVPGGQTFLEMIERCYVDFRNAIDTMVLNNTCRCNACANVSGLDLKFFVHFGSFARQRVGDITELVGRDVNVVHRLLKNRVVEATGIRAYALFSDTALAALELGEAAEAMVPHVEHDDTLGEIPGRVLDLHPVWQEFRRRPRHVIAPEDATLRLEVELNMPPHVAWDYLSRPEFRSTLMRSDSQEIVGQDRGRVGEGSTYVCYHGKKTYPQRITEWRPFEHLAMVTQASGAEIPVTLDLEATDAGTTRLVQTLGKTRAGPLKRLVLDTVFRLTAKGARRDLEAFKAHVEGDRASRGGVGAEPSVPSAEEITAAAIASLRGG
jgi:uncharacterized protein YndB with AHSA1/START domain